MWDHPKETTVLFRNQNLSQRNVASCSEHLNSAWFRAAECVSLSLTHIVAQIWLMEEQRLAMTWLLNQGNVGWHQYQRFQLDRLHSAAGTGERERTGWCDRNEACYELISTSLHRNLHYHSLSLSLFLSLEAFAYPR